ncbi:MAG: NAD-dependent epimerase/dehydratase family protein [Rubricoccaceae bacterium]|nr:NAD-dependent epimerase/dehydratase family protein [Rubricoccaceae bacterium]
MRAFVTGGTGFVGSHLVEELLRRGYAVRCLVRSEPKWLEGLPVTLVHGDLSGGDALREGVEGVDLVYHVAGLTRAPEPDALRRANVEGTLRLLDAADEAGTPKVLVTSSLAAAGPSRGGPLIEDDPMRPISDYGRSKAEMEQRLRDRFSDSRVVVVRPTVVYGPREADIYTVIRAADKQRVFPLVRGGARLDIVHVRDLVRGMADAAEAEGTAGETYFLGGPRPYTWGEVREAVIAALGHGVVRLDVPRAVVSPVAAVVEGVARLVGRYPPLNREKAREAKAEWVVSSEKARAAFGYAPEVGLAEGMRETVAWYRTHGWL